jgi:CheY-like chemotaxis protein
MDDSSVVLLIEDNPDDAELIAYAFKKVGIQNPLVVVDDGDKAFDYLSGHSAYTNRSQFPLPALILLDLKLPRRSGFELLEVIRSNEATRRIPVVILTSSNQDHDIEKSYDLGANSYLVKPIGRDALINMVRSFDSFWIKLNKAVGHD